MPINPNRRLRPDVLKADRNTLLAIFNLREYTPFNTACSPNELTRLRDQLEQTQQSEFHARNAYEAARDAAVAAEHAMHEAVQLAKQQIIAQYGDNSDAVSAVGLKRRSERRRPILRRPSDG